MIEVAGLFFMALGCAADPCYLPALFIGYRLKAYGKVAIVGVLNGIATIAVFALFFNRPLGPEIVMAKILAGVLVASVSYAFGAWRRKKVRQADDQYESAE